LLIFVNPAGGTGKSQQHWNSINKIISYAGFKFKEIMTLYRYHCQDYILDLKLEDLLNYDGIIAVGGDGIVFEILNGLFLRSDRE
jgi:diacylglycerol kinase family enzyme